MKRDDFLQLSVLINGEGIAVEVGDDVLLIVDHRGMQQHFVHVFAEDEDSLIFGWILLGRRRLAWRWGWLILRRHFLRRLILIVLRGSRDGGRRRGRSSRFTLVLINGWLINSLLISRLRS